MKVIVFFLALLINKSFGFINGYKNLFLYNFSNLNIVEENCNEIMDYVKTHNLACFNYTEVQFKSQNEDKPFFQSYVERFYEKNKEEISYLFNKFVISYEKFRELTNNYMIQTFAPWIFDLSKFVKKHRETIDYYTLSLITDIFDNMEVLFKTNTDIFEDQHFGKVYQISRYSSYKPEECLQKYYDIQSLTCVIVSKNYYIMKYNNFINNFVN